MNNLVVLHKAEIVDNDAIEIGELYRRAKASVVDSVRCAVEAGQRLIQKKAELLHGAWLPWLESNINVLGFESRVTAARLMKAAKCIASDTFNDEYAIEFIRTIWGHNGSAAKLVGDDIRTPDDGCTVENLNELILAGKRFAVIYADPPWEFKVYSGKGKKRSAERHYETKSLEKIKELPVAQLTADDSALFLWCVMPEIPGALEIIKAWGFTYKTTAFTWIKQNRGGEGLFWGMGYWTRANAELCLLATRGSPKRKAKDVHQVVMAPVGEHSRKPDEVQVRIERLLGGPTRDTHLELYGRRPTPGWTVWGNQITRNLFQQQVPEFVA